MKNYISELADHGDTVTATIVDEDGTVISYLTVAVEDAGDLAVGEFPKPGLLQRLADWWNS